MQVLVVDDIAVNRKVLRQMLGFIDCSVIEAEDGQRAIEMYQEEKPDLILMDIRMPGIDGYLAADRIKGMSGAGYTPIIFVTALTSEIALSAALDSGGDDFISKPINVDILHAKIKAHLRIREFNQQLNNKNRSLVQNNQSLVQEQKLVEHFFNNALKQSYLDPAHIKYNLTSMSAFNGDILLAERSPNGGLYVVLGDFTGHGLTAAMGTLPTALVFFSMVRKGSSLAEIAREINHKLVTLMPSEMFLAAILLELSPDGRSVTIWAGGMPDGYWCESGQGIKGVIRSRHLSLGILSDEKFDAATQSLSVGKGDKLYFCSDGVTEAASPDGEVFGTDRIESLLSTQAGDKFKLVMDELKAFRGGEGQHDDISFVEINCDAVPAPSD